jgi:hypothetical protein
LESAAFFDSTCERLAVELICFPTPFYLSITLR